ncbi:hypothetical protein [Anaplasma phagocytophilum]|uniref:hypothetical protein n=1 Tax=Anaplasma phagocytophilum TaxID=948 RepID=UPI0018B0BE12|nr:hypothetical protein [Anaplasma phagocytophilum]
MRSDEVTCCVHIGMLLCSIYIVLLRIRILLRQLNELIATSSYEVGVAHEYEIMTYYRWHCPEAKDYCTGFMDALLEDIVR